MQTHNVFLRKIKDKVIVTTILDAEDLKLPITGDHFIMAQTENLSHTGLNMSFMKDSLLSPEELLEASEGYEKTTEGMSVGGVLKLPIWFNKMSKSINEMMYG